MKIYDREKRKWVDKEEYERNQNKRDRNICRGKKPHDFVLVLPSFVTYNENYKFNPEDYYKITDETADFMDKQLEKIKKMGIEPRWYMGRLSETRIYICSVCKKQKYDFIN